MITIDFLADHPATIPTLVQWFRNEWPDYFANKSQTHMVQDFRVEACRDRIPCRLIAFESNELVGTIVLRKHASDILPAFQPGLGGLFVVESHRGHGIGTELIRSGMVLAVELGYDTLYATTTVAAGILERLGWEFIKTVIHPDQRLALYWYQP